MAVTPALLNARKRDGAELSATELGEFVRGVVDGSWSDAQLGAFLMAVCCRGMTVAETTALTLAMRDSGTVLDLRAIAGIKVDKHSTGGVGDKVSIALAPLVASCGVPVPMISGRGLGHTGGTIDKLAAIPGYQTALSPREFVAVLEQCGFVMAAASTEIAPADRRMYATRDVTGTVASIPLITASILSKKLAEGIDALVMDVKCGRAAFLPSRDDARALMQSLVDVGSSAGLRMAALMTDMDTVLGRTIGNRLELLEAVQLLRGEGPDDLREVTFALGVAMLQLGGKARDAQAARALLEEAVRSGRALACLERNLVAQGGDPAFLTDAKALGKAPHMLGVACPRDGFVTDVDPLRLGLCAMALGAGRRQMTDPIDLHVGIVLHKQLGEPVTRGEPLALVQARTSADADRALAEVFASYRIGDAPPPARTLVSGQLGSDSNSPDPG